MDSKGEIMTTVPEIVLEKNSAKSSSRGRIPFSGCTVLEKRNKFAIQHSSSEQFTLENGSSVIFTCSIVRFRGHVTA